MKDCELNRYKAKLIELRSRTRLDINRMMDVVLQDAQSPGEHDRKTSESVDKEVVLENTEEAIRNAATAALDRIENGTFGLCQDCHKEIPKTRLKAIPYTPYCVDCERKQEKQEGDDPAKGRWHALCPRSNT